MWQNSHKGLMRYPRNLLQLTAFGKQALKKFQKILRSFLSHTFMGYSSLITCQTVAPTSQPREAREKYRSQSLNQLALTKKQGEQQV